jgi:spore cortex formation protein SpoVR/YcgB (stage V sporulation)
MELLEINYKRPSDPKRRYAHWQWGEEYEELVRKFPPRMNPFADRIINPNPVIIYCLDEKTLPLVG